jgi:hypothetical protein
MLSSRPPQFALSLLCALVVLRALCSSIPLRNESEATASSAMFVRMKLPHQPRASGLRENASRRAVLQSSTAAPRWGAPLRPPVGGAKPIESADEHLQRRLQRLHATGSGPQAWPGAVDEAGDVDDLGIVETRVLTEDRRFDRASTTSGDPDVPSRSFLWPGKNLCFDAKAAQFVASSYETPTGYVPEPFARAFPDRHFMRSRGIKHALVTAWVDGFTIIVPNFRLNETRAHTYFRIASVMHLVRFAVEELHVPAEKLNLVFDDLTIPAGHDIQRELFDIAFRDVPADRRHSRASMNGLTCFKTVLLHDRLSAPQLQFTMWPEDMAYLRRRVAAWRADRGETFSMRSDCATDPLPEKLEKVVWIVQRRVAHNSRVITNLEELKRLVRRTFGPEWRVLVFDSANTPCRIAGLNCLGLPTCPQGRVANLRCGQRAEIFREVRLFNQINVMIGVRRATLVPATGVRLRSPGDTPLTVPVSLPHVTDQVHGATFMNALFMPAGATIVEIFPAGIDEYVYHDFAVRAGLSYIGFREPDQTKLQLLFPSIPASECFHNRKCRTTMREQAVTVSLEEFEPVLRRARDVHAARCDGERLPRRLEGTGGGEAGWRDPHEPPWMHIAPSRESVAA